MTRFAVAEVNELAGDRAARRTGAERSVVEVARHGRRGDRVARAEGGFPPRPALLRRRPLGSRRGLPRLRPRGSTEPIVFRHQATVLRTAARARLAAHAGSMPQPSELARLAVDVAEQSGYLNLKARRLARLADGATGQRPDR